LCPVAASEVTNAVPDRDLRNAKSVLHFLIADFQHITCGRYFVLNPYFRKRFRKMEKLRHPEDVGRRLHSFAEKASAGERYNFGVLSFFDKYLLSYVLKCFVGECYVFYFQV